MRGKGGRVIRSDVTICESGYDSDVTRHQLVARGLEGDIALYARDGRQ